MATSKVFLLVAVLVLVKTSWCAPEYARPKQHKQESETSDKSVINEKSVDNGSGSGSGTSNSTSDSKYQSASKSENKRLGIKNTQEALALGGDIYKYQDKSNQKKGMVGVAEYDADYAIKENGKRFVQNKYAMSEIIEHRNISSGYKECTKYVINSAVNTSSDNAYIEEGSKNRDTEYDEGHLSGFYGKDDKQLYYNKSNATSKSDGTSTSEGKSDNKYENKYDSTNERNETSTLYINEKKE